MSSSHHLMWIGALALAAAGCGSAAEESPAAGLTSPTPLSMVRCPDPTACTLTNGTGVYFEEAGAAGIGPNQLLITHFINNAGGKVTFQARYLDPNSGYWLYTTGNVMAALYNGVSYSLVSLGDSGTYPFVTLKNAGGQITVWGYNFPQLVINLSFAAPVKAQYALSFGPSAWSSDNFDLGMSQTKPTVTYKWDMHWTDLLNKGATAQPYCQRAPSLDTQGHKVQLDDSVVFQHGFDVDPVSGAVLTSASDVTLSCRYGAPATAYLWGYDQATDPWHFAGAIHMKRASYCGDGSYHTVAGTHIEVQDEEGTEGAATPSAVKIADGSVEAFWGPNGAICYNQPRRTDLGKYGVLPFNGLCNGQPMPRCDQWWQAPWYVWIGAAMNYAQTNGTQLLTDGVVKQ